MSLTSLNFNFAKIIEGKNLTIVRSPFTPYFSSSLF